MSYKLFTIIIFLCTVVFNAWIKYLEYRSGSNPLPENVKHVYDQEKYNTYKAYHKEKSKLYFIEFLVSNSILLVLLITNAYAYLTRFAGDNIYLSGIAIVLVSTIIDGLVTSGFDYTDTMKLEQKYEFNKTTKKTFFIDMIKNFLIGIVLSSLLVCLLALLYTKLGDGFVLIFIIVIFVFVLLLTFLAPVTIRIFNKLRPLEEGELREQLEQMLHRNGYQVKQISVMDGSKRSTKANAFFGGFGKFKTIVLYDTLLEQLESDEIVAVFAHEMAHGKHRDTLKTTLISLLNIGFIAVALWFMVANPEFCLEFGFPAVNYGFVVLLASTTIISFVSPLMELLFGAFSRRMEYRADEEATKQGYGKSLAVALTKLSRNSLSDLSPDPLLVKLTYSHPTLSQRLTAIDQANKQ